MVPITLSWHAGCAGVEVYPYRAELVMDGSIVLDLDDLAFPPGWMSVLKVASCVSVHVAVDSLDGHPNGLGIDEHHPVQL